MVTPTNFTFMDNGLEILTVILPAIVALILAVLRSAELDKQLFVDPAIEPVREATLGLSDVTHTTCREHAIQPFVEFSIWRSMLVAFLGFLSLSLLSTCLTLLSKGESLSGVSFLLYFIIFLFLNVYYTIAKRDVFHWWTASSSKYLTIFLVAGLNTQAKINPDVVDVFGYAFDPKRISSVFGVNIDPRVAFGVTFFIIAVFLLLRNKKSKKHPSLRRLILGELDLDPERNSDPHGGNLDDWVKKMESLEYPYPLNEVKAQLIELTYQGAMRMAFVSEGKDVAYKKRR